MCEWRHLARGHGEVHGKLLGLRCEAIVPRDELRHRDEGGQQQRRLPLWQHAFHFVIISAGNGFWLLAAVAALLQNEHEGCVQAPSDHEPTPPTQAGREQVRVPRSARTRRVPDAHRKHLGW